MTSSDKQIPVSEKDLLGAARSTLEYSNDHIDEQTLAQLKSARRNAVDVYTAKQSKAHRPARLFPVAGFATVGAALLVAVTLWTLQPSQQIEKESAPIAVLEDLNLLTGSEEIEFYQDLEFYEWLAVNEQAVS